MHTKKLHLCISKGYLRKTSSMNLLELIKHKIKKTKPSKHIIFLATSRSGSTFISETISRNNVMEHTTSEWFHPQRIAERRQAYCMSNDSFSNLEVAKKIADTERSADGVFSIKLNIFHWLELQGLPHSNDPESCKQFTDTLLDFLPNPIFIHIIRKNELRQAISWARSLKTGVWHNIKNLTKSLPATFDFVLIHSLLNLIKQENLFFSQVIEYSSCRSVEIIFEDFRKDTDKQTRALFRSLGLKSKVKTIISPAKTKIASDGLNNQWEKSYHEMLKNVRENEAVNEIAPMVAEAFSADIEIEPPFKMNCEEKLEITVKILNTSEYIWPALGCENGNYWVYLEAKWHKKDNKAINNPDCAYLPFNIEPGSSCELPLLLTAPEHGGEYQLTLRLVQSANHDSSVADKATQSFGFDIIEQSWKSGSREYFGDCPTTGMIWSVSPWFGNFQPFSFPWIYHKEHGWIFAAEKDNKSDSLWFWDSALGWWMTTAKKYPEIYLQNIDTWVLYHRNTTSPREFKNINNNEGFSKPKGSPGGSIPNLNTKTTKERK